MVLAVLGFTPLRDQGRGSMTRRRGIIVDACAPDPHPTLRRVEYMPFHGTDRARPFFDERVIRPVVLGTHR